MNRRKFLSSTFALLLFALMASPSEALVITAPIPPSPEVCIPQVTGYFGAPASLIDCPDPNCGRLNSTLRHAAQTRDAREILIRAAFFYYLSLHPEVWTQQGSPTPSPFSTPLAQALADLAVTGQGAYSSFRQLALREADLIAPVTARLTASFPSHQPLPIDVSGAVQQALQRSYQVAWALRGPTPHRQAQRAGLGWIAVDGEDDPPHRPVNVPSAPFSQHNMTVQVNTTPVVTRYVVASRHITDNHPVDLSAIPPDRGLPLIIGDIILFIHGHSSSLEEAMPLIGPLLDQATAQGRPVTLIAMDLPSNGYSSMIEHTNIAAGGQSNWNTGYPILDFIENFIVAFVDQLEAQQPGIKGQIVGVIGGSLGGNMTLRLGRRDPAVYPWLHSVVSWSPASSWLSWARAVPAATAVTTAIATTATVAAVACCVLCAPCCAVCVTAAVVTTAATTATAVATVEVVSPGKYLDLVKSEGVRKSRDNMMEVESLGSLHKLFYETFAGKNIGRVGQADHWYSNNFECAEEAKTGSHRSVYEIYNASFRRWHWRVGHEQLIFSHWDSDNPDSRVDPDPKVNPRAGPARYSQIKSRVLLATGADDNQFPEHLYDNTRMLGNAMTMVNGTTLFLEGTGHAIAIERPIFFANRILNFLFATPPPPFPYFLIPGANF